MNIAGGRRGIAAAPLLQRKVGQVGLPPAGCSSASALLELLMPNLTFALAVLLYAVFKFHPLPEEA